LDEHNFEVKMTDLTVLHTAIHEAGHAVAHVRLGIMQQELSIFPKEGTLGHATAEGAQHVWSAKEAEPMVLAYLAGYAALIAAGHGEGVARAGADSDFAEAEELIKFWGLAGSLDDWRARAVELMAEQRNVRAVALIAEELTRTLPAECAEALVDVADGGTTQEEYLRFFFTLRLSTTRAAG
jgi:hypothetical protein